MSDKPQSKANVLVVDDEQIILSMVEDTLSDEGYDITTTMSPNEAIELAGSGQFDFLLTDIRMPAMNGIELAREIRSLSPTTGVIFMTGYANLDTAKQAIKEGACDYIMKPFELSEIRQALARAVEKRETEATATLSKELTRIADLSNMIYASGDLASLLRLSLSFAIIQGKAEAGIAVYFDFSNSQVAVMEQMKTSKGPKDIVRVDMAPTDWDLLTPLESPTLLKDVDQYPLATASIFADHQETFLPKEIYSPGAAILVPLRRADQPLGFLTLFHDKSNEELACADTQFLNFISSQLAISLENLRLLEDSREAYRRLEYLQEQSIQMEKMATRGQMAAEIGHELNNYLGVVVANFQLMNLRIQKGITEGLERFTDSINDHLDKISRFTNGLMDYSSMQKVRFEEIDIVDLMQRIVEFLHPQKRFREFDIEVIEDSGSLIAEIDQGLIEQVLYNFLNNAADASRGAELKRIEIKISKLAGDTVRIIIKDFGEGIAEDRVDKLFKEKFTTKETGHGIGLVVCKGIIDKHQGRITVKSSPGQGAEFIIDLPIFQDSTEKTEVASAPAADQ